MNIQQQLSIGKMLQWLSKYNSVVVAATATAVKGTK